LQSHKIRSDLSGTPPGVLRSGDFCLPEHLISFAHKSSNPGYATAEALFATHNE